MYRAGSLRAVVEELSEYKLNLMAVEEVRWDGGGTKLASEYTFSYGMRIMNYLQIFSYIRESYQRLRGLSSLVIGCHT
jgi:hypothetical protein